MTITFFVILSGIFWTTTYLFNSQTINIILSSFLLGADTEYMVILYQKLAVQDFRPEQEIVPADN